MTSSISTAMLPAEVQPLKRATPTDAGPCCVGCGEVIGVYERLVLVKDGIALETSRAAQPQLSRTRDGFTYYHAGCVEGQSFPRKFSAANSRLHHDGALWGAS